MLGLIKEGSGVGATVLKNLDLGLQSVCRELEKLIRAGRDRVKMTKLPQTPQAKNVIEFAIQEVRSLNHNNVGTEHLLFELMREDEGVAAQMLLHLGLNLEEVRE